ncbi:MAG TPA: TonB-dependent receptor [Rhodanobacteraceae bacterium]|nr:TonB-dependent receptor [Rhodanobacteraceae bacterium]
MQTLPTIEVVATPLGVGFDLERWPGAADHLDSGDFAQQQSPNVVDALLATIPALSVGNQTGNSFEPNVQYHGFTATPLTGTPEGLAVYQNGVRINEAFGDNVHWDFIPPDAIRSIDLISGNPLFGLNALGGALDVRMKTGFDFRGVENGTEAGSYGRLGDAFQWGGGNDRVAAYLAADAMREDGFRDRSGSTLRRVFGDLGYRNAGSEVHLDVGAADDAFDAPGTTPVGLLEQRRAAVFTTPQSDHLKMWMANLQGNTLLGDAWKLAGNLYYRHFSGDHLDGNDTDVRRCSAPMQRLLCFGEGGDPANAADGSGQLPDFFSPSDVIGEIDGNRTRTAAWGVSVQSTNEAQWFGARNRLVVGASADSARTTFAAAPELGIVDPETFVVVGNGQWLGTSTSDEGSIGPVRLRSRNTYFGVYALDTLQLGDHWSLAAGGRFNRARIDLEDLLQTSPGSLTGDHDYSHFNPMAGATARLGSGVTAYAGYSKSNRAPIPLELGCSDPAFPCIVDSFLVADPDLKQVVARTIEAGLRGKTPSTDAVALDWRIGVFRTDVSHDILDVAAPIGKSFGYFANVGDTRRQGAEASFDYRNGKWSWRGSAAWTSATYRSHLRLNPPEGDPAGNEGPLQVRPGDRISGIPAYQLKAGIEYRPTPAWTIGLDALQVGSQYFGGDESNQNPRLPGYAMLNLRVAWKVAPWLRLHAEVLNAFDRSYSVFGTWYDAESPVGTLVRSDNPETLMPGMPRAFYVGLEISR